MISPATRQLLPYALIVLIGYIGFSLPLPLLPEMFLDPDLSILPSSVSLKTKTFLLGLTIAAYPLGQLIGSPILGTWSDSIGRKRVILFSLMGNGSGYIITALSVQMHSVAGIIAGLFVSGFSEGSIALAQAAISDVAANEKIKHFGLMNFSMSLGFVLGPLMGGLLADSDRGPFFTFATPFWAGAFLCLFALVFVASSIPETRSGTPHPKLGFVASFHTVLENPIIRRFFAANFFLYLGLYSFWRFFPVFLEQRFHFSAIELAFVMSYESIIYGFTVLWFIHVLRRWMDPKTLVLLFSFFLVFLLVLVVLPPSPIYLLGTILLIGVVIAAATTNFSVMISDAAHPGFQGQTMGTLQAVQLCADVLTGIVGGVIAGFNPAFPLFVGASMVLVCCFLFRRKGGRAA